MQMAFAAMASSSSTVWTLCSSFRGVSAGRGSSRGRRLCGASSASASASASALSRNKRRFNNNNNGKVKVKVEVEVVVSRAFAGKAMGMAAPMEKRDEDGVVVTSLSGDTEDTVERLKETAVAGRMAASSLAACVVLGTPLAALASDGADISSNMFADFMVPFLGISVDHKTLVYALVLGQFIGFVGAMVSGVEARARKAEVEALNLLLVQVNQTLREQARASKTGAYMPVHLTEKGDAIDLEKENRRSSLVDRLKEGKRLLKEHEGEEALNIFQSVLNEVKTPVGKESLAVPWKAERKALRGVGAAYQVLGQPKEALPPTLEVVKICDEKNDPTGRGDALGVVADLYTELGDLEMAGKYYDMYLDEINHEHMENADLHL